MKKRILSAFLAICLVVTLLPTLALASEATFSDMPSDYSTAALKAAVSNGLLKGSDGKILPNDPLTRAQMAAIIVRAFGATEEALLTGYTDVSSAAWYYKDLGKAVKMKVLQGDGVRLNPEDTISRQQAFAVLARALKLKDGTSADLSGFSDKSSVASWAVGTTAAMVNAGFIQGSNGKLNPTANISRKDFAVMMNNIFKTYVNSTNAVTELAAGTVLINVPGTSLKDVTVKGDLIIGDGVGNGDVTLDNVIVTGRMIVRGGGVNSIIIRGNSSVGEVVVSKVDGNVRIAVEGGANVEIVYINDGKDDVIVEGSVDKLVIDAPSVPVTIKGGTVGEVSVNSNNATVMVDKTATVTSMTASGSEPTLTVQGTVKTLTATAGATGATIEVAKGGAVDTVNAGAPDTAISGEGSVKNANVTGNNVSVDTKGTEVKVSEGVTGTTAGGNDVKPGETANTGTGTTGGSPGGGGGGGSSVAVSAIRVSPETLTLTAGGATGTITATVSPADATNKTVTWTSSNEAVATVAGGVVTPLTAGTTTITATTADGSFTATTLVTVEAPAVGIDVTLQEIFAETGKILISVFKTEGDDSDPATREIPSLSASDFILIKDFGGKNTKITGFTLQSGGGTWEYKIIPAGGESFAPGNYRLGFNKAGYGPEHIDFEIAAVQTLAEAKTAAEGALASFTATNATTEADVLAAVNAVITNTDITSAFTVAFAKTDAVVGTAGSVTGTITLTLAGTPATTDTVVVNLTIAALPVPVPVVTGTMTAFAGSTVADGIATFSGVIPWYAADASVDRAEGNRVGIKIIAPTAEGYNTTDIVEIKIGDKTYNWADIKDGDNYFEWWPLITEANKGNTFTATIKWNSASEQTFTIKIADGATLQADPSAPVVPEVTGTMAAFAGGTVAEGTATFAGEIPWYAADASVDRAEGNRVGIKIIAPTAEGYNTTDIVEIKIGDKTYNWADIKDGDNYFEWWPLITEANKGNTFTATIKWNSASEQTFIIKIADGATLQAILEAPGDGLKELAISGLTTENVKFLAFGLMDGQAQKVATLEEVRAFLAADPYKVTFNTAAIKVESGKLSIDGSILSTADWRKVKAVQPGDSDLPYRITVLINGKTNKVAKIAMYEDGNAVIEQISNP